MSIALWQQVQELAHRVSALEARLAECKPFTKTDMIEKQSKVSNGRGGKREGAGRPKGSTSKRLGSGINKGKVWEAERDGG